MNVDVAIHYNSNGKVYFFNRDSIFSVKTRMSSYFLVPPLQVSENIRDIENETLIQLMQQVIYGFSAEPSVFNGADPFLHIDQNDQEIAITTLKNIIGPTISEL